MKKISVDELLLDEKIHLAAGNSFWTMGNIQRAGIPVLKTADGSNGIREQYKDQGYQSGMGNIPALCYPGLCSCGCSFDEEQIFKMGRALGEECKKRKISVLLGPGINIKRNPLCGRSFEYISEDPLLSGILGAAFIRGVQSTGVAACPKHFAANSQETRRSKSDSAADDETLFELYLRSFEIAVKEGRPWVIMGSYNRLNGIYCCENQWLLNDVLRNTWGFDGTVISDWGAVNDIARAVTAGLDTEMPGAVSCQEDYIKDCVKKGELSLYSLNKAAENVIKLALRTTESRVDNFRYEESEHIKIAGETAESSFVLLKNDGILPISKEEKILVVGSFAKVPRYQGTGSGKVKLSYGETPLMILKENLENLTYEQGFSKDKESSESYFDRALKAARGADKVLFFAGLPDDYESEGTDRENMKLPDDQNRLIRAIARINKNIAVFIQAGSPVELLWRDEVKGIMMCYLGGSCLGSALYNVISGKVSPSGRLAESFPHRLSDVPSCDIYPAKGKLAAYEEGRDVGYRYYNKYHIKPAYPFGFGLSYTTFEYSCLEASEGERIDVSCRVKNTGDFDSREVVQIYINKKNEPKERILAAFKKVFIAKGHEAQVHLKIDPAYISCLDKEKNAMVFKRGEYVISAGRSSAEMILETELSVSEDRAFPIRAALGQSENPENFHYMDREECEITPNTSLRELEHYRLMRPVIKAVRGISKKIDSGIISKEKLPDYLMDSPFRQVVMGTNGIIKADHIRRACGFFNKIINKKRQRGSVVDRGEK